MKTMNQEELDQRIDNFMKRKMMQFPELREAETSRPERSSLLARMQELTSLLPHIHNPRQAHQ